MIQTINPYNNQVIASYAIQSKEAVNTVINQSHEYQKVWSQFSFEERGTVLKKWAEVLNNHKEELAYLAAVEMGKPLSQGVAEVDKCIRTIKYYADETNALIADELVLTEAKKSYIHYAPLGVVLGIMPWNFPFWQVLRAFAPIAMVGNTFILKHASQVTGCAMKLKELWDSEEALPKGLFDVIVVPGDAMEEVIAHKNISAVTFTGSTSVGSQIASTSGRHLKKHLLELGGSDAYIIMEDADIELAIQKCAQSRLNNAGQSCIAAKRIIIHQSIADTFINGLKSVFESKVYGDPLSENVDLGPMSKVELRNEMHQQIMDSLNDGAILITGGYIPEGENALYPPTIVSHVKKGMRMYHEEVFGPAVSIIISENDMESFEIANDTEFGLGGGIFSADEEKAERLARKYFHTGFIAINDFVSSDPRLPFGGVNKSGYGRELSKFGLMEFCNVKTIFIK